MRATNALEDSYPKKTCDHAAAQDKGQRAVEQLGVQHAGVPTAALMLLAPARESEYDGVRHDDLTRCRHQRCWTEGGKNARDSQFLSKHAVPGQGSAGVRRIISRTLAEPH